MKATSGLEERNNAGNSLRPWLLRCKKLLMTLGLASLAALPVAGEEWHVSGYGIKWNGQYDLDSVPEEHADEPGCTFVFIDVLSEQFIIQ